MTMSLARGLTTIRTTKRKKKPLTQGQLEKLQIQWRQHNKDMRRRNMHNMQFKEFDDYVAYTRGEYKPKQTKQEFKPLESVPHTRQTKHIPSYTSAGGFAPCTKKETMQYTGERRLVGIATMHKSNMVPIFEDDNDKNGSKQATEIAQMRRN